MTNTKCKFTRNSFFYNKGNISNCCLQDSFFFKTNWDDISDLNEFFINNRNFQEVRNDLANGCRNTACRNCWADEDLYGHSMRTNNNYFIDNQEDNGVGITHVDLRLSNRCNLQCRMCTPYDSDQLAFLSDRLTSQGIDTPLAAMKVDKTIVDNKKLLNLITKLPDLKVIKFAGGEPFIMPEVEEFLQRLIELKRFDLTIEFITNCTSVKTSVIEILKRFRRVEIACSIDGVEEAIEYQRYPVKWSTVEKNFIKLYNSGFYNVGIHPCIGLLNYLSVDKLFKWASQYPNTPIGYNEIYDPSFLNFRYIPVDVRKEFQESFSKIDVTHNDPKWVQFQAQTMYEYLDPTQEDCNMLYEYSQKVWDSQGRRKFLELYPWAEYIIARAKK